MGAKRHDWSELARTREIVTSPPIPTSYSINEIISTERSKFTYITMLIFVKIKVLNHKIKLTTVNCERIICFNCRQEVN